MSNIFVDSKIIDLQLVIIYPLMQISTSSDQLAINSDYYPSDLEWWLGITCSPILLFWVMGHKSVSILMSAIIVSSTIGLIIYILKQRIHNIWILYVCGLSIGLAIAFTLTLMLSILSTILLIYESLTQEKQLTHTHTNNVLSDIAPPYDNTWSHQLSPPYVCSVNTFLLNPSANA